MRWLPPLLILTCCPAQATTLLVPEQYLTIQAGLNAGLPGDIISVAPGTYYEHAIFPSDGLTLLSRVRHGATIDGGGTGHVVVLNNHTGTVDGFVVTGGGNGFYAGIFTSQKGQTIVHNVITGNAANGIAISSGSGGWIEANEIHHNGQYLSDFGILVTTGAVGIIVNNLVCMNTVGIGIEGDGLHHVYNNTITGNGWNCKFDYCYTKFVNNIVTGGEFGIYFSGFYDPDISDYVATWLTIHHNDVWDNEHDYYAELGGFPESISGPFTPMPGQGEIHVDPQFVGAEDFHLLETSPCIDAGGTPGILFPYPGFPETDLDGNPRLVGAMDIGAYEHQTPTLIPIPDMTTGPPSWSMQAAPNPFLTTTRVDFTIALQTEVALAVYDVSGRLVRTLVKGNLPVGLHTVTWDRRDETGAQTAEGTYFVRFTAGDVVRVQKLVCLGPR